MYQIKRTQNIPIDLKKAWNFFSLPDNLKIITPDYMNFEILSKSDAGEMYPGMIITYTLSPLFHISINWATEISQVKEYKYFIDNQIKGPYKIWHHEHHFKETGNGIEMRDILYYEIPFGFLGRLMHKMIIGKKLNEIFNYREQKIKELFG
ncbi:MAG TPA: SRPBCC family protein [Bacteroidales bacterium]|nr:SRPBCC family protein [Bacteroidales bacterium]